MKIKILPLVRWAKGLSSSISALSVESLRFRTVFWLHVLGLSKTLLIQLPGVAQASECARRSCGR